jgi:2-iminobutanoate/2-iminopropanoate deaminase
VPFEVVETSASRPAGGRPYSPALRVGDWLVISGQAATGEHGDVVGRGDPAEQWRQCLRNIRGLVEEAGGTMADVVELTIYVTDVTYHLAYSEIRREFFTAPYPTATALAVTALAHEDWLVEISARAYLGRAD